MIYIDVINDRKVDSNLFTGDDGTVSFAGAEFGCAG